LQQKVNLLKKAELPTTATGLPATDLIQTMAFDKKAKSGHVRHVLLSSLGQACLRHDIPEALIREALAVIGSH
jgi:3-dehydroquinate synthetase